MKSNVVPFPVAVPAAIRQLAGEVTLDQLQRAHLAAEAELDRPRLSTLIALLPGATPTEREAIIRQLEAPK